MQKIGSSTNTADANGEFTDGDPQTQIPCTWVMAAWLNTLQRELVNLCEEAGITIDPNDDTQVYQAIQALLRVKFDGLGTAAFNDIVTSMTDTTAGRVPVVGWMGLGGYGTTILLTPENAKKPLPNGFYGVQSDPAYGNAALISFGYDSGSQVHIIAKQGGQAPLIGLAGSTPQGVFGNWGKIYTEFQKPTAAEVGAMPYFGTALNADLNTLGPYSAAGVYYQPANAGATAANHYPVSEAGTLLVTPGAYGCQQLYITFGTGRVFSRGLNSSWNGTNGPWGSWNEPYSPTNPNEIVSTSANSYRIAYGGYGAFWRQDGGHLYLMLTNKNDPLGNYNALRPFYVDMATGYPTMSRLNLTDWTYFDARYGGKNTTSMGSGGGWWQDSSTGLIMQMGIVNRTGYSTTVTFPKAFPNYCIGVTLTLNMYIGSLSDSDCNIRMLSKSNTSFVYGSNGDPEKTAFWVAFGK
ncbi:pyocin knob domain-containing protein [Enterobacter ludwigii]